MGAKISGNDDEPIAEINIVPFVDIILVVLIIFMVSTPFIVRSGIKINLPKAASSDETVPSQFQLSILPSGEALVNGKSVSLEELAQFAKDHVQKNPEIQAIIAADKTVSHGRVIELIDTIKSAGISKFAITTDNK
ncbi:MAG: biopolymer transporter ExbD [Bdellovibrionales bacterium]|nr:biopolymer transporter ExbD [Bdellovibrionales bacterium]